MSKKTCPPFCDQRKSCPDHNDLLVAIVNCSDQRDGQRANIEQFETTVKAQLKKGWKKEDDIPDPVKNYRFPLLHWAGVLGKCKAIEWMLKNGFSATVLSSETHETALHRCVLCLHYAGVRRLGQKIGQLVALLKECLPLQDKALQTPLHAAATKLIKGNKADFYEDCLEMMVAKAKEMPGQTFKILDARDMSGNTAMHYLAQTEIGFVALRAFVHAGADIAIKNKEHLTPLDIAINNGSTRIIKALSTAGKSHTSHLAEIYTTDSPPESPDNGPDNEGDDEDDEDYVVSEDEDQDGDDFSEGETPQPHEEPPPTLEEPPQVPDTPPKESSAEGAAESCAETVVGDETSTVVPVEIPASTTDEVSCIANEVSGVANEVPAVAGEDSSDVIDEVPPDTSDDIIPEEEAMEDAPSASSSSQTPSVGVQTPEINPYSCIIHIKKEMMSLVAESCEKCRPDSALGETSCSLESQPIITPNDLASSVVTLLKGAGLLDNLKDLAEKTRSQDEHVLTEKLEQVKETNASLESGETQIEQKNEQIKKKLQEIEELRQQVSSSINERDQLFRKRKRLNEECNTLQKKLHCCDSLLKVVPKVNSDGSDK